MASAGCSPIYNLHPHIWFSHSVLYFTPRFQRNIVQQCISSQLNQFGFNVLWSASCRNCCLSVKVGWPNFRFCFTFSNLSPAIGACLAAATKYDESNDKSFRTSEFLVNESVCLKLGIQFICRMILTFKPSNIHVCLFLENSIRWFSLLISLLYLYYYLYSELYLLLYLYFYWLNNTLYLCCILICIFLWKTLCAEASAASYSSRRRYLMPTIC